jgi:MATE family multidrug resistance protein
MRKSLANQGYPARQLPRRFARLTFLNILSNLTVPLASLVDTALLGHLPDIRFLAGVALASIIFEYVYWSFGFLRMGTTGTTAQALGAGDREKVYLVLYRSLTLALTLGISLLLVQVPLRELGFALLTSTEEVEQAGREYFNARIWAAPAVLANFTFVGWFLGREESRRALLMTVVGHGANIVLDYLFIVRLGLAAFGAGLATTISQYMMLASAVLLLLFSQERPSRWISQEVLTREPLSRLFRLNRDILVRTVALISAFALFLNFSAVLGTFVLAANTILFRLKTLVAYLVDGAAFATESLAGIFRGEKDLQALLRLRRLAFAVGTAFTLPFLLIIVFAPGPVYRLLTSHAPTLALAADYGPWLIPTLLFGSTAYIYDGYFLGLTEGRVLRNAMLVSTLGGFLPLALLALALRNNHLLWLAMTAFMLARTATLWRAVRDISKTDHPQTP